MIQCDWHWYHYLLEDSGKPFQLKNVMHVPGLKKNLFLVTMLEDRGYGIVFSDGKSFL
jgi:hypothetical protein